jgi:hypothetical protein
MGLTMGMDGASASSKLGGASEGLPFKHGSEISNTLHSSGPEVHHGPQTKYTKKKSDEKKSMIICWQRFDD